MSSPASSPTTRRPSTASSRAIADRCYAEISPRTFPVLVRKGSRLNQLRIRRGSPQFTDTQLRRLHAETPLVDGEADIEGGLALSIDLKGSVGERIGWRAKRHTGVIDVDRRGGLAPLDYWDPIEAHPGGNIILDPDEFYILASREAVAIPPEYAAEMVPFNPLVGEFRVHYAGFFDPGFGYEKGKPPSARGVLEVRSREVPFILEHGQIIGRLVFERLTDPPPEVYGAGARLQLSAPGPEAFETFSRELSNVSTVSSRSIVAASTHCIAKNTGRHAFGLRLGREAANSHCRGSKAVGGFASRLLGPH